LVYANRHAVLCGRDDRLPAAPWALALLKGRSPHSGAGLPPLSSFLSSSSTPSPSPWEIPRGNRRAVETASPALSY